MINYLLLAIFLFIFLQKLSCIQVLGLLADLLDHLIVIQRNLLAFEIGDFAVCHAEIAVGA